MSTAENDERALTVPPPGTTALTVLQEGEQKIVQGFFGVKDVNCLHNFGKNKQEVWRMTALATAGAAVSKEDSMGKSIPVKWFYAHKVWLPVKDRPGEYNEAIRTVLIDADKHCYQFVSEGIADDLYALVNISGLEPFDPPVAMKVVSRKTNAGFNVYRLVPADM